jgi:molybdopterin synthase catalytic subunit
MPDGPHIVRAPLDPGPLLAAARRDSDGGIALFVGVVRDHAGSRPVTSLEYEAYEPMAEREIALLVSRVSARHPGTRLVIRHRVGRLAVGEVAVVVVAAAPHREEAFAACREGIEEVKARAPIWKREFGPGGASWVDGCLPGGHSETY